MQISVIVPTLDEAAHIGSCLSAVRAQRVAADVIVVDGGSVDETVAIAREHAQVVSAARGRGTQMNAGARLATGDVLLFLHADSLLPEGALVAIQRTLVDPATVAGTFRLRFDHDTPALRLYAWCTRFRWRLFHYGDQGIVVRRHAFDALGGFREWPLMEDVDFLARLSRIGRVALLPLAVTTSARRFERHGVIRQQLLNAVLVGLYLLGVSPLRLARWYRNVAR